MVCRKLHEKSGNVLFVILIAVALFASLSYAITNSSRSQGDVKREIDKLNQAEFDNYIANVNLAVSRLTFQGCDPIDWTLPEDQEDEDKTCHVFHPDGGGAYWRDFGDICPDGRTWDELENIGDRCGNIVYAGMSGGDRLYTTPNDQGLFSWNDGSSNFVITNIRSSSNGRANTDALVNSTNADAPYQAANICRSLGDQWYLPAIDELTLLYTNNNLIGGFEISSQFYWTSTELGLTSSYRRRFNDGTLTNGGKQALRLVRCVRKQ